MQMFIATLFTIDKIQKQPQCPSMYEWIKKTKYMYVYTCTHVYTAKYYSAIKKE